MLSTDLHHRPAPRGRPRAALGLLALALSALTFLVPAGSLPASTATLAPLPHGPLELLGEITFPTGTEVDGHLVGGLSGLTCEPPGWSCWAISDDRSEHGPARIFTLDIDLADGRLEPGDIEFTGAVVLRGPDGDPFPTGSLDPEGVVRLPDGELLVSSEGDADAGIAPFIRRFSAEGHQLAELPLPSVYLPTGDGTAGVRSNLALESLTVTPDHRHLFTATENALAQEGPKADLGVGSPARILRYDRAAGGPPDAQYLYWVDPVDALPRPDVYRVSGLVDLLALDARTLLALERSYVAGLGNRIRLYHVSLADAEVLPADAAVVPATVVPARKSLLADLDAFGLLTDNLEGMTLGPTLPDGRRTLLMVSDDNFNPVRQTTQFLAFALDPGRPAGWTPLVEARVPEIQGAGHRSPLVGHWARRVPGIVVAVEPGGRDRGFWMVDPAGDGDPATSDGIFVATGLLAPDVEPGDRVRVSGLVEERVARSGELPVTRLSRPLVDRVERGVEPPPAVVIGAGGRVPPDRVIEDDGLTLYQPSEDGIDFWESLEGMRLRIPEPLVVGPTSAYGDLVVVADGGAGASGGRSRRGGLLLAPDDAHPERLTVAGLGVDADVGDRFAGPLEGVLDYAWGTWRLRADGPVPERIPAAADDRSLRPAPERLTVATFNLLNLALTDDEEKFAAVAEVIAGRLGSPDVVALQEVQDDSGPEDDGTVSAEGTLARLVEAVAAAGGRRYSSAALDPANNADGGRPGANIRVALLWDPRRVDLVERPGAGAAVVEVAAGRPRLVPSPARVARDAPAFAAVDFLDYGGTRKPLAAELRFADHTLFVVVAHLSSKGGDDRLFGAQQPPRHQSEAQRREQAAEIHRFVEAILVADPAANVIVLGDLNEFPWRRPLELLEGHLLTNLIPRVPAEDRYTFVFAGNSQILDHILVSRSLLAADPRIEIVHGQADLAHRRQASDHDPVVASFDLE